jgi:tetratricopeptide (TPR) repeat protein
VDDYSECLELEDSQQMRGAVLMKRAGCYWDLAQIEDATKDCEEAAELSPGWGPYATLAFMLVSLPDSDLRDPERAVGLALKAVELQDNYYNWMALGFAQLRNGDLDAARESLDRSLAQREDAATLSFLAMVHYERGDSDQARQYYERGLQCLAEELSGPNIRYKGRLMMYCVQAAEMLGLPHPRTAEAAEDAPQITEQGEALQQDSDEAASSEEPEDKSEMRGNPDTAQTDQEDQQLTPDT